MSVATNEIWRVIPDFNGFVLSGAYSASNLGRIRSNSGLRPGVLADFQQKNKKYRRVNLYAVCGRMFQRGVHQLVAMAFYGPPSEGRVVNHKDADPTNNHVGNLEYVTQAENIQHASKLGRLVSQFGESNGAAKLTESSVSEIKYLISLGYSNQQIGDLFTVHAFTIQQIRSGRCWAFVPVGAGLNRLSGIKPRGGPTRNYRDRRYRYTASN